MTILKRTILAAVLAALALTPQVARAMDELDLSVGFKTLPLLDNKLSGTVPVAVIYDPKVADLVAEATAIDKILNGGFKAPGDLKLSSQMVSVDNLAALSNAKIGILTKGSCTNNVSSVATTQKLLTMTGDLDCVKNNRSVLGIVARPNVEIYLSRSAADANKVSFSKAFIMIAELI